MAKKLTLKQTDMKMNIQNFRVFNRESSLNISPITLLIGANNSGKSSVAKLLLLLKNGFQNLNFKEGEHQLGAYKDALNWNNSSDEMKLTLSADYTWFPGEIREELIFHREGELKGMNVYAGDQPGSILSVEFSNHRENSGLLRIMRMTLWKTAMK